MPNSVIHILGLAVYAAITIGTFAVYYALNGGEQLHVVDPRRQRNRRGDEAPQLAIQQRPNQVDVQRERDDDNSCRMCNHNIQSTEYDLTTLSCNHSFHCRCISDHLRSTAVGESMQSACPICRVPYSIDDIL